MKTPKLLLAHLALFTVMLIYGANYTISKEVMPQYVSPLGLVMMRVIFGTIVFWILHLFFFPSKAVERKDLKLLFLCSAFGIAINQMLFYKGLAITKPINASVIMLTTPIAVFTGAVLFFKEKVSAWNILGVVFACLGASLIILYGNDVRLSGLGQMGDIFILLNAVSFAAYLLLVQPLVKKYDNIVILKWVFTFGMCLCLPIAGPEMLKTDWAAIPLNIWFAIAYVLIFVTIFTYLFYGYGLQKLPSTVVGVYVYLQPVIAASIAIAAGKDELTIIKVTAAALIFSGVYLANKRKRVLKEKKI